MIKTFQLGMPDYVTIETNDAAYVSAPQNPVTEAGKTKVEFEEKSEHTDIYVTSEEPVRSIRLRWKYQLPKKALFLSDAWERSYGDLGWRGMSARTFMPWYFLVSAEGQTMGFGVKVRPSAMCYWQADTKGITLFLDIRCGGEGVELHGRRLQAAQIVCIKAQEISSFEAAQLFCKQMCTDPVFPEYPVYGSNNWYYAYGDSSEEEILSDTDYVLELARGIKNPPVMVIDDCWQEHRRLDGYNGGPWRKGNSKFPDMGRLAEQLKAKGVRPGIWIRLLQNEDEEIPKEWRIPHNGCLDPSHPDALAYIRKDVERICKWGYVLIKHDFSTYDLFGKWGFETCFLAAEDGWHFYDRGKTSAEIVRMLYEEIYQASRMNNAVIIGCNTIGHLGAGLMHLNRTGDDTSGLLWERTRRMGINTLAFRLPQHGAFYHVDADCVGITGKIPWEKNRQWADVVAQSGTPLFVSVRPGVLNPQEKEELGRILAIASEQKCHKIPLDWKETDCPQVWGDKEDTVTYDWFEEEGPDLDGTKERFCVQTVIP